MSDRRTFMKNIGGTAMACSTVGGLAAFLEACGPSAFVTATEDGQKLSFPKEAMDSQEYIIVKNTVFPAPVLVRKAGEGYFGLLMLCTHMGCEVKPSGTYLVCPCHGSQFDRKGKVLTKPADKDLTIMNLTADETHVYIEHPGM